MPPRPHTAAALKAAAPLALPLPALAALVMFLARPLLALALLLAVGIASYLQRDKIQRKVADVWWTFVKHTHEDAATRLVVADPAALREPDGKVCLVLIRDASGGGPWTHLAHCALHADVFDAPPEPHGVPLYQTALLAPATFRRRRGALDAVAADLFAGRAGSLVARKGDLPSLAAIAASTGCRVVAAASLATPRGAVHALGAPFAGRPTTAAALGGALDAAEALARRVA